MDRKILREYTHKASSFLGLDNNNYKQWVFRYTFLELEKDLGAKGDITTKAIFTEPKVVTANIVAKGDGVLAGCEEIKYFLVDADVNFRPRVPGKFDIDFKFKDGDEFKKGDVLFEIKADIADLLIVERVMLNLLMRMSGVATHTKRIVEMVKDYGVLVTPTRKSLWGLIDKKAVVVGGGGTHRLGLYDAILVKDTHLDAIGRNLELAIQKIIAANNEARFVEIEVESPDEALELCKVFSKALESKLHTIGVLLLDNMNSQLIGESMDLIKKNGFYDKFLFEASGGINEDNALEYAKTGVDILSMGSITSGVKSVDMSMKVEV